MKGVFQGATAVLLCVAGLAEPAAANPENLGKVIITEIFCNPANNDDVEFIEIFNTTNQVIDISGWYLDDEDSTHGSPFPAGTMIGPHQALAVIGRVFQGVPPPHTDANHQWTTERLEAAFGPGAAGRFLVVDLNITVANTPTIFNEVPFIVDADGDVVDIANYENAEHGWPAVVSGHSIQLRPQFLNSVDNDRGCAWMDSGSDPFAVTSNVVLFDFPGTTTYRMCEPGNICSPGYVNDIVPPPTDCNGNGINDVTETCGAAASAPDCNANLIPDSCEPDLNHNGVPDTCDIVLDREGTDRNLNNVLDSADINNAGGVNGVGGTLDTNSNGVLDTAEDFGKVIITEFLIDSWQTLSQTTPNLSTGLEWVEIQNVSAGPVDISGYRLVDVETGGDGYTLPVPAGNVLQPGEIAVLCQLPAFPVAQGGANYTDAEAIALYQTIWGATTPQGQPIRWIPLGRWGARAFNATATSEVLTLVKGALVNDAIVPATQPTVSGPHPTRLTGPGSIGAWVTDRGSIMDMANYSNANSNNEPLNGWPGTDSHSTFELRPGAYNVVANNAGPNWHMAIAGLNGAHASIDFSSNPSAPYGLINSGEDFGSPGYIPSSVQQPTGEVTISEIAATTNSIYPGSNPTPPAGQTPPQSVAGGRDEYVEIVNRTASPINLTGWYLQDEDGRTQPFPAGTILQPSQAAVIIGVDTDAPVGTNQPNIQPLTGRNFKQEFYDAWGCGYPVIQVTDWYTNRGVYGLDRLADSPSFINEILRLVKPDGAVADIVNFDDDDTPTAIAQPPFGWPNDGTSGIDIFWSIYSLPGSYDAAANDDGRNWASSLTGFDGGRQSAINTHLDASNYPTGLFNKSMYGSPGYVEGVTGAGVITPPGAGCQPCRADFNASGAVTVQDIFDFLAAYFTQAPAADINGSGAVTVQDIFDYLALYFAGCP
jgi:hypothetical protein